MSLRNGRLATLPTGSNNSMTSSKNWPPPSSNFSKRQELRKTKKQQFATASRCSRSPSCRFALCSSWWPLVPPWPADLFSSAAEDPPTLYSNTSAHYAKHCLTFTTMQNTLKERKPSMRWAYSTWQPFSTSHPPPTAPNNGAQDSYNSKSTQSTTLTPISLPPIQSTSNFSSTPTTHTDATTNTATAMWALLPSAYLAETRTQPPSQA